MRDGGGGGYLGVDVRDVAHDVVAVVEDGEGGDALAMHQLERFGQWAIATTDGSVFEEPAGRGRGILDGHDWACSNAEILQRHGQ